MGNKSNTSNAQKKAQAKQVLPSGEMGSIGAGWQNKPSSIKIKLAYLNLSVLSQTSLLDPITLVWKDGSFYCLLNKEVLGKVPNNYNNQLIPPNIHDGNIVKLNKTQPLVVIEVDL